MTVALTMALAGLVRAPARTAIRALTLAAAAGLLASMLLFVGDSLRTMTASAVRAVPLDWQGPVASSGSAISVARAVAAQPGVQEATAVATAPFAGIERQASGTGTIRAGAGAILAIPPGYLAHLHTFRLLRGSLALGTVVLDQQLAATVQAQPGDLIRLYPRPGGPVVRLRVGGIGLVTAADPLFQPLNSLVGPAPAQPPANVLILPLKTFVSRVAPLLQTINSGSGASAVPGAQTGTQWQVQVQTDPSALSGGPAQALHTETAIRNRVERSLPGRVVFVDNLAEGLNSAAGDALYAETLFIMLALPGALVALGLAYLAALGTAERDRRSFALLRARGADRRDLIIMAIVESLLLALIAAALATAAALSALHLVGAGGGISLGRVGATAAICVVFATFGAAAARIAVGMSAFRGTVGEARRTVRRRATPLWQRLYLDLICLAGSGLVYWLTLRTGFSAVVNPDSNPTLSLSVYMFLAPALLWIGAVLLLLRIGGRGLAWLAQRVSGDRATTPRGFLLVSAARRREALNRGLLLIGLLLAFGVNLGIFTATYNQQARIDAQLTLGADVVATAPAGTAARVGLARRVEQLPGVAAVSAVDHSYAYVGPDLQDTFGIDAATLAHATSLRDSYFLGGTARQVLRRLGARPDAILVSRETITDYGLKLGDLLRLRVLDHRTGRFRVAPFHVVGVVQEFPSAPKDSFMVVNQRYLEQQTHDGGPSVLFVRANGDPRAVAETVAAATARFGTRVNDIQRQDVQTVSSITTVDLRGISQIEEIFIVFLAAAAMTLQLGVALAERKQELATMAALGASLRRVGSFLWSEIALILTASLAVAAVLGWLLAEMLVAMLQHVFDPPPDHLALPWTFLAALAGAVFLGTLLATAATTVRLRRLPLAAILRED
jgi:putative ABC transport system permease protein